VCEGKSRLEYCLESADKSPSPLPCPALAGSKVGLAAVVISKYGQNYAGLKEIGEIGQYF